MPGERNMIPFKMWPGSWGLKGKTRAIAQAEYELEGYELEHKLAEINHSDPTELSKAILEIDLKYKKISQYDFDHKHNDLFNAIGSTAHSIEKLNTELKHNKIDDYAYDKGIAELTSPTKEKNLAILEVELKYQRITDQEYERRKADINEEPWIAMPKIAWDPVDSSKTYFELDYNDFFLDFLRENGYQGTDDECINRWLNDVCYSVLQEMDQPEPEMINTIRKIRLPDGKTEHS